MIKIKTSNRNTNKHTQEGMELLENSINKVGIIESISVATDGTIISGHARKEIFDKQGKVPKEIKLESNEYPVILTDIENNTKQYFEAQILANTTANKNFDLDIEEIELISEEFDIDIEEVGIEVEEVEDYNETDYSRKNKEIDTDDFEDKMILKLQFNESDYHIVKDKLLHLASTPEQAIFKLLGLTDTENE